MVPEAEVIVSLTAGGYIKRMPIDSYHLQNRGGKGVTGGALKEEDQVDVIVTCNTHDNVYFFTDRGKMYLKRAWDIPEGSRTARGTNAVNLLSILQGEKILSILSISTAQTTPTIPKFIFMSTEHGTVKKTALEEFTNVRSSGITAIKLDEGDSLSWAKATTGSDEILLVTARGKSIRFKEADVRPMGRSAAGVRGIRLATNDRVIGTAVISSDSPSSKILVVSERGFGKQTEVGEYTLQNRGGGGIFTAKITSKTGPLVGALLITAKNKADLILNSKLGQVIRLPLKDVPVSSRATQGVTLMRFDEKDGVAAVTTLELDKSE